MTTWRAERVKGNDHTNLSWRSRWLTTTNRGDESSINMNKHLCEVSIKKKKHHMKTLIKKRGDYKQSALVAGWKRRREGDASQSLWTKAALYQRETKTLHNVSLTGFCKAGHKHGGIYSNEGIHWEARYSDYKDPDSSSSPSSCSLCSVMQVTAAKNQSLCCVLGGCLVFSQLKELASKLTSNILLLVKRSCFSVETPKLSFCSIYFLRTEAETGHLPILYVSYSTL